MFWFDRQNPLALYMDKRNESYEIKPDAAYQNGSIVTITPDIVADFTAMPFPDETFHLVVFDPPHLVRKNLLGVFTKKYGALGEDWRDVIKKGFSECFRVLKPNGTLIFKWAESEIAISQVLALTPHKPLFGHKTRQHSKTHWVTFFKTAS